MKNKAVLVGDFQFSIIPEKLRDCLSNLIQRYEEVVIVVRTGSLPYTSHYPLPFRLIKRFFPSLQIMPLIERKTDEEFSDKLDELIDNFSDHFTNYKVFVLDDCFEYKGKNEFATLNAAQKEVHRVKNINDYYKGIITGLREGFGSTHAVVDIGIIIKNKLVCGTKKKHNGLYCLPGGFVDPKLDTTAEEAACREVLEETGYDIPKDSLNYLKSLKCSDYRFVKNKDKIMTFVFTCFNDDLINSQQANFDDLDKVFHLDIDTLTLEDFIEPHRELVSEIITKYKKNGK